MANILTPAFKVTAGGGTKYLMLYLDGLVDRLKLFMTATAGATDGGPGMDVTLFNGYGGRAPELPYPYTQDIPNVINNSGSGLTGVTFDLVGTTYQFGPSASANQTEEVVLDPEKKGQYLMCKFHNGDVTNDYMVTVYAAVT